MTPHTLHRMSTTPSQVWSERRNEVQKYCLDHSTPMNPLIVKLSEETMKLSNWVMMGAPEVINMNTFLIKILGAKKVIEVGVFTGVTTLAMALQLPEEGKIIACDITEEYVSVGKKYWKEAGVDRKIDLKIAPAQNTLDELVKNGESGTFDFVFIDADKSGYDEYYEKSLVLLRKGGIVAVDNTVWGGKVVDPDKTDPGTMAIKALNEKISKDSRVVAVQLNVGDGYSMVTKL